MILMTNVYMVCTIKCTLSEVSNPWKKQQKSRKEILNAVQIMLTATDSILFPYILHTMCLLGILSIIHAIRIITCECERSVSSFYLYSIVLKMSLRHVHHMCCHSVSSVNFGPDIYAYMYL